MESTNTKTLLRYLTQYHQSFEDHLSCLTRSFILLENRWRLFKAVSQGDYADQFRSGWERTEKNFEDYIEKAEAMRKFLGDRIEDLNKLNQGEEGIKTVSSHRYGVAPLQKIGGSPDIAKSKSSQPEDQKSPWDEWRAGTFSQKGIETVPLRLKGLYYIHSSDFSELYIGKSDYCVKLRLSKHLRGRGHKKIKELVDSGKELFFFCHESPDPKYEEAIEIKKFKEQGLLETQKNEFKPLTYLD